MCMSVLFQQGEQLHILFTWLWIRRLLHHLLLFKVKNRWQRRLFLLRLSTAVVSLAQIYSQSQYYRKYLTWLWKSSLTIAKRAIFKIYKVTHIKENLTWGSFSSAVTLVRFHHEHLTPSPQKKAPTLTPTPTRDEVLPEMSVPELLVLPSSAKAIIPRPTHHQPRHYRERQPSNCHQTFLLSPRSPRAGVGGVARSLPTASLQSTEQ